jgi:hypothetical protein
MAWGALTNLADLETGLQLRDVRLTAIEYVSVL